MEKYKKFLLNRGPEILKDAQQLLITSLRHKISNISFSIIEAFPDKSSIKYLQLARFGNIFNFNYFIFFLLK